MKLEITYIVIHSENHQIHLFSERLSFKTDLMSFYTLSTRWTHQHHLEGGGEGRGGGS